MAAPSWRFEVRTRNYVQTAVAIRDLLPDCTGNVLHGISRCASDPPDKLDGNPRLPKYLKVIGFVLLTAS
jgi:hypothetical protein